MIIQQLGRLLILIGGIIAFIGAIMQLSPRFPWLRIGRLPGDFAYQKGGFSFFFPLTTMILASLVLTGISLLINFLRK